MISNGLFPPPQSVKTDGEGLELPQPSDGPTWTVAGVPDSRIHKRVSWALGGDDFRETEDGALLHLAERSDLARQAYILEVSPRGILIEASDLEGLHFGLCTLRQWLRTHRNGPVEVRQLPSVRIEDHPDFEVRGVMLDVSRNKVPTLATLEALIDELAGFKINHLQLYTEHTFAYTRHEAVWRGWSPYSAADMRHLDRYCADRFIELAPNQNSFGHLHRWLVHPQYKGLAECPEGVEHPFGFSREPFSLCPGDPASLELLEELYDELLPCFSSRKFNVGLDETFDLGEGRSKAACEHRGKGRVYLDFLNEVHRRVTDREHTMLFWGDIILENPDLIPELPQDAIALEWGYEADHPFEEHGRRFRDSGRETWVCPGTSSWNSIGGRTTNSRLNLARAAAAGKRNGATGYLITDWGDFGHLQPLPVSLPGFVAGAGHSWNSAEGAFEPENVTAVVDQTWDCPGVGDVLADLGDVHLHSGATLRNHTSLFQLFNLPGRETDHPVWEGLHTAGLERCVAELHDLSRRAGSLSDALLSAELKWATDLLLLASNIGRSRYVQGCATADLPKSYRDESLRELAELEEGLVPVWLARNRPGGLPASRERFEALAVHLRASA